MSQWTDVSGRSLPVLVAKQKNVPRQVRSEAEAESVSDIGVTGATTTSFVGLLNSILMIIAYAPLNKLWSVLNSQQVVLQMPLMKNIKYPANALIFTDFLMNVANLDLVPTEFYEDVIYYLPE